MRSRLSISFVLLSVLSACSDSEPAKLSPDAGGPRRFEATPAENCPAAFRDVAPRAGANVGFDSAGQSRSFELLLPDDLDGPAPVFLGFHGTSEKGAGFYARAELADFVERGFIVVAPDGNRNGTLWPIWDGLREAGDRQPNADVTFASDLVACLAAHYPIDRDRIYAGGHSAGGIFTNRLLRERSDLFAGGIVGSGVWSFTETGSEAPLDSMIVIVTWGGSNDQWMGRASEVQVPEISFVAEAALASQFYEAQPNVAQAWCRGDEIGHEWLPNMNDWLVDTLLAYPKGTATHDGPQLMPTPEDAHATCGTDAVVASTRPRLDCGADDACEGFCQITADCVVTNPLAGPILGPQLTMLGYEGMACGGCVERCTTKTTTAADREVLACIGELDGAMCADSGIAGVTPWIGSINRCCEGRTDSPFCRDLCTVILSSSAAATFFEEVCAPLTQ